MANDLPEIGNKITLDVSQYERSLRDLVTASAKGDKALEDLGKSARRIEQDVKKIQGDVNLKVKVNDADLRGAKRDAEALGRNRNMRVDVDRKELTQARRDHQRLGRNTNMRARVNDADLTTAKRKRDDLDQNTSMKANVDGSELEAVHRTLQQIQALATISVFMQIAGPAMDVLNSLLSGDLSQIPILGAIQDLDRAIRMTTARTGEDAEDLADIIQAVYTRAFGESGGEVADLLTRLRALNVEIEDLQGVAEQTFRITAVFPELDKLEVVRAASRLVAAGMADDWDGAFDIITTGMQRGLNVSGDFLDTLSEYGGNFQAMGIDADQMLTLLNAGLDLGALNADRVANFYKEIGLRATDAVAQIQQGDEGGMGDILRTVLGSDADLAAAGRLTGVDLVSAIIGGVRDALEAGTITEQAAIDLLGPGAEDLSLPVALRLDPSSPDIQNLQVAQDATLAAGNLVFDDLETAWTEAWRTVESVIARDINEAFDIQGKLQEFTQGIRTFAEELRTGATFGEALEKATGIEGLQDVLLRVEKAIVDLALAIMQSMAQVLEFMGQGDAARALRGEVANIASGRLEAEVALAVDGEQLQSAIDLAIARGVDADTAQQLAQAVVVGMIEGGDFDAAQQVIAAMSEIQPKRYESIADMLDYEQFLTDLFAAAHAAGATASADFRTAEPGQIQSLLSTPGLFGAGLPETGELGILHLRTLFSLSALTQDVGPAFDVGGLQGALTTAAMGQFNEALAVGDFDLAQQLADTTLAAQDLQPVIDQTKLAMSDWAMDTEAVAQAFGELEQVVTSTGTLLITIPAGQHVWDVWENGLKETFPSWTEFERLSREALEFQGLTPETLPLRPVTYELNAMDGAMLSFQRTGATATAALEQNMSNLHDAIRPLVRDLRTAAHALGALTSGGGALEAPGFSSGGFFSGVGMVHAGEMLVGGRNVSVLNSATSRDIMSAVQVTLAGMGLAGGGSSYTVNNTFNTGSMAEAAAAADITARRMRGLG